MLDVMVRRERFVSRLVLNRGYNRATVAMTIAMDYEGIEWQRG